MATVVSWGAPGRGASACDEVILLPSFVGIGVGTGAGVSKTGNEATGVGTGADVTKTGNAATGGCVGTIGVGVGGFTNTDGNDVFRDTVLGLKVGGGIEGGKLGTLL